MSTPTATETSTHRIKWWVWAGGQKMRHTAGMRGTWGWDASCSCGWETRTGGGVKRWIDDEVWAHKNGYSSGYSGTTDPEWVTADIAKAWAAE